MIRSGHSKYCVLYTITFITKEDVNEPNRHAERIYQNVTMVFKDAIMRKNFPHFCDKTVLKSHVPLCEYYISMTVSIRS